ncbi:recombination protein O N-terminal domain-containing protein [Candidatus Kaiserbacteria bacterium]|nr:recombination protein O N-terminal domain-containing protein [Candidatus Kaiserbacteria bacterium]
MRHKYSTRGIVLARTPLGEANGLIVLLTEELGLLRARAQGIRRPGARLAPALATYAKSDFTLVRGREGWRIVGAIPIAHLFSKLGFRAARVRSARVVGLVLRLVAGEAAEPRLFPIVEGFFNALATLPEASHEAAESLAVLAILAALGLDSGERPPSFDAPALAAFAKRRSNYVSRINRGIEASGL